MKFARVTLSDRASAGIYEDRSGPAIEGFFDIPVDHLQAGPLLVDYFRNKDLRNVVAVSPDAGGVGRANKFRERIGASLAIIAKQRPEPDVAEVIEMVGDVDGKTAVIVDDMISTGGTLVEAAKTLEIVIQLGAILAVIVYYRSRLLRLASGCLRGDAPSLRLALALAVAFVPAALAGIALHRVIKERLFGKDPVGVALIGAFLGALPGTPPMTPPPPTSPPLAPPPDRRDRRPPPRCSTGDPTGPQRSETRQP